MAWRSQFGFFALAGRVNSGAFTAMAVLCMFVPAAAALITQKLIWKEPLRDLGLTTPRVQWLAVAWLLPILLVIVALALSLAAPGVSLVTGVWMGSSRNWRICYRPKTWPKSTRSSSIQFSQSQESFSCCPWPRCWLPARRLTPSPGLAKNSAGGAYYCTN